MKAITQKDQGGFFSTLKVREGKFSPWQTIRDASILRVTADYIEIRCSWMRSAWRYGLKDVKSV